MSNSNPLITQRTFNTVIGITMSHSDDTQRDRQMNTHPERDRYRDTHTDRQTDRGTQKLVNIYCEQLAANNCQPERHTHEHHHRILTTLHHTTTVQIGFPPRDSLSNRGVPGFLTPTPGTPESGFANWRTPMTSEWGRRPVL